MLIKLLNQNNTTKKPLNNRTMKQTAVEWLVEQITDSTMPAREAINQAKAMEKEQIMDAYIQASISLTSKNEAEQYYNETFKSE